MKNRILSMYSLPAYQQLKAYYERSTLFSVLGAERSENRHSAFLAWLLNPSSSHSLGETPIRKFLTLAACKATDEDKCYWQEPREHLISSDYRLDFVCIKTEQSIIALANNKKVNPDKLDIWILIRIRYSSDNKDVCWTIPIVVENKIFSKEGKANGSIPAQTERYCRAINNLKGDLCPDNYFQPILIYLTAPFAPAPTCNAFIHVTYQDLLDHVIQPLSLQLTAQRPHSEEKVFLEGYIRNLSFPAATDGKKSDDYSILAIAESESKLLETLFSSDAFMTIQTCHLTLKVQNMMAPLST